MKSIEEEEKKPPAKRSRNAPAEDTAWNQNEIYPTAAHITILDEAMQSSISRYLDIYDWDSLKETSKLLSSWPKPPPPKIDYHLIRFCITNCWSEAYCGVAKTLNAVKEAFRHVRNADDSNWHAVEYIALEFMYIEDCNKPDIPLVQYYEREHCQRYSSDELSWIHPHGKHRFGVQGVGEKMTKCSTLHSYSYPSTVKQMLKMDMNLWVCPDPSEAWDADRWHDGLFFDDPDQIFLFVWLDGAEPLQDIDLTQLFYVYGLCENDWDDNPYRHEIWLNKKKSIYGESTDRFTFGPDGNWAICNKNIDLWDT